MREEMLAQIRETYSGDRFATENGAVIEEVGENYAKCSMQIGERHINAAGAVMGGVYFTLADFAFAVAIDGAKTGIVSLNANIDFLGAASLGDIIIAKTVLIKHGRNICVYRIEITNQLGKPLALVKITGFCKL